MAPIFALCGCSNKNTKKNTAAQKTEIIFAVPTDKTGTYANIAKQFSAESPTTNVNVMGVGNDSCDFYRIASAAFMGGEIEFDMCLTEDIWLNDFAENGYVREIGSLTDVDGFKYIDGVSERMAVGGKTYLLPIESDVGILYTLKANGASAADKVFEQRLAISDGDDEKEIDKIIELIHYWGSTEAGLEAYKNNVLSGTGQLADFKDGKIDVAMLFTTDDKTFTLENGDARNRISAGLVLNPENRLCSVARIYGVTVNKNTDKINNVKEFLKFLCKSDTQKAILKGRGTAPVREDVADDSVVQDYSSVNRQLYVSKNNPVYRRYSRYYMRDMEDALEKIEKYIGDENAKGEACAAVEKLF